ncbi:MAG: toll/interleukin-1 receptor domain-containing protein [Sneathiella sp.]
MIFLSHNRKDKPVVEPVAIRLSEIYGQDKVFYDSWSMQPGDGIIEKMNEGLTSPDFVFFFVSEESLASRMVELEWQTSLFKATQGHCKIIPIRVDGTPMPAILMQNLYIDMFAQGIEATILQIVNVIQGNNTFTSKYHDFSNLTYKMEGDAATNLRITISASHLMEPNPEFLIMLTNEERDFKIELNNNVPFRSGFNRDIKFSNGIRGNAHFVSPLGGAITPKRPLKIEIEAMNNAAINVQAVLHQSDEDQFTALPRRS